MDSYIEEEDGNHCYSLLWILLLAFVAWPVAGLAAGVWTLLQPFEAVVDAIQKLNRFLDQFVTWPRACGYGKSSISPSSFPGKEFLVFYSRLKKYQQQSLTVVRDSRPF